MAKILSNILPKSVKQFKSSYNFNFIAKHFVHSNSNLNSNANSNSNSNPNSNPNSNSTLLFNRLDDKCKNKFTLFSYPNPDDQSFVKFDIPSLYDFNSLKIHGHSHGLICLSSIDRNHIFLCNPNTRECRQLPPSILQPDPSLSLNGNPRAVGFGYDPESNDFKVVRIVHFHDQMHWYLTRYKHRVEIYYLSTDQWREIDFNTVCEFDYDRLFEFEMYHEGVYYWGALSAISEGGKDLLLSFDMSKEVFRKIPLPPVEDWNYKATSLEVWNGSIVYILYPLMGELKTYHVWAMEKYEAGRVSWSKLWTIGPHLGIERPLSVLNSDELLMEAKCGHLISYNVNTKEIKYLPGEAKCGHKVTNEHLKYLPLRRCSTNLLQSFVFEKSSLSVKRL